MRAHVRAQHVEEECEVFMKRIVEEARVWDGYEVMADW